MRAVDPTRLLCADPEPPAPKPRSACVTIAIAGDSGFGRRRGMLSEPLTSLGREPVLLPSEAVGVTACLA